MIQNQNQTSDDEWARDDRGRFGPGNKGGPGRAVGSKYPSLKSAILRAIDETKNEETGRDIVDALAQTALQAARDGDFRFWKEIIDRLDGPIKQQIEQDSTVFIDRVSRKIVQVESSE